MLRTLAILAMIFAAGPGLAVLSMSIGCYGDDPLLGVLCGHNGYFTLLGLTLLFWLLTVLVVSVRSAKQEFFNPRDR